MKNPSRLHITTLYDNVPFHPDLATDWGLSFLIQGLESPILFDTGAKGDMLLENMHKLDIDPESITRIVLSHEHKDHIGGLNPLSDKIPGAEVWMPHFFPEKLKDALKEQGLKVVDVEGFSPICPGAYTTGIVPGWIREQSLVLESMQGLVVLTGCSHPRIINILEKVKQLFTDKIHMVLGGFHLGGFEKAEIKEILHAFRTAGVEKVGPAHCTGTEARQYFQEEFGDGYLEIGVGREIDIP